ncbi:MAG TPA: ATP-binding protein [Gemmatimonadaceae bacterium]|nr:ATP-binding protein [Gemmatimonadaceae bacterium]
MTRSLERLVLDALPVTVYAVDLEGRITLANGQWQRFARANGAPQLAEERGFVGRSIWDQMSDVASREQIEHAMETLRAGRTTTVTWEFPCSSPEEERIFLMQISAVHDGRAVSGYVFSTVDITPSHRSREVLIDTGMALARTISVERVLQEVTHQLRHVMACDGIAIALTDAEGEPPRLVHHSGFDQDAATIEDELGAAWQAVLEQGRTISRRTMRGLEITAPMTGGEGALGVMTMTAERVQAPHHAAEAERVLATIAAEAAASIERAWLVRRVEHKRRLEAIGEVAAGVAHELRNPLFGISSAAQLLRFRVKEDPVVEKNVGRILREVERLNGMVTSLLEYGRPAPQKLRVGDPDAVWDEVLDGQRGLLEAKALVVRRARPRQAVHCRIDPEQLAQVFLNVLVNAVDAAPEGSDLALASQQLPAGGWRCRLQNVGTPIPADVLPRVFELFFSTKPGGTGIGLALCQRIVEEHGGNIGIESSAEQGTTLAITIPATHGESGAMTGGEGAMAEHA